METTLIRPTQTATATRWTELQLRIEGTVITPDDPQYDEARQAWNLTVDQRPAVIVVAAGAADSTRGPSHAPHRPASARTDGSQRRMIRT